MILKIAENYSYKEVKILVARCLSDPYTYMSMYHVDVHVHAHGHGHRHGHGYIMKSPRILILLHNLDLTMNIHCNTDL